ncbi:MAG: CotH kinase family protein [Planctomycetaceae bacterium]
MINQRSVADRPFPARGLCCGLALLIVTAGLSRSVSAAETALTARRLFDPLHLVDVQIELPADDWDTLRKQTRSFAEALKKETAKSPFTYQKGHVTIDGVRIENVGIRKKGFLGSLNEQRPSLKIKFSEYVDQQPTQGLDRLTLNNNNQDASRLSTYMTYKLFNESGTVAPRCNFAKVTVNGKYLGIYSNVESVKPPFLKHGFGDAAGALFEGTITDFFAEFAEKFEKKNKHAKFVQIRKVVEVLERDELDLAALDQLIDIKAFVKFWATESLVGFWDGYTQNQNNFFIYQNPADTKFYFIPWGTDSAFTSSMPLPPFRIRPRAVHSQSVLANRLYRHPQTQELYHETIAELMDKYWDEELLLAELDRVEKFLKPHVLKRNRGFSRGVDKMRTFVKTREDILKKELADGPITLRSREKIPIYFKEIGEAKATFTTQWYAKTPAAPEAQGEVEIELQLDGKPVAFQQMGVIAEYGRARGGGERPPTIIFTGKREPGGKKLTLSIGMTPDQFHPTAGETVAVGGMLVEGFFLFNLGNMKFAGGTASLENAAMEDGSPVKGKITVQILQMTGGKPVRPNPARQPKPASD